MSVLFNDALKTRERENNLSQCSELWNVLEAKKKRCDQDVDGLVVYR